MRKVKSNSQACDDHTCAAPKCYGAVGLRGDYCVKHTCAWNPCSKKGGVNGSLYCQSHKCETPTCQDAVASKVEFFCETHRCQYMGMSCRGGWTSGPPYCDEHRCIQRGCETPVRRGGQFCKAHTCMFRANGHLCVRPRKAADQYCDEHGYPSYSEVRESTHVARTSGHRRDDMYYMYVPRSGEKRMPREKRMSPRGSSSSLEERVTEEIVVRRGSPRYKGSKGRTPPPRSSLPPERAVELVAATKERALTTASGRLELIPKEFRADAGQALAYGCGFQDACHHMAGLMTMQMEELGSARPMSPSRHMAKIDGPRFTSLAEDDL